MGTICNKEEKKSIIVYSSNLPNKENYLNPNIFTKSIENRYLYII